MEIQLERWVIKATDQLGTQLLRNRSMPDHVKAFD